MLIKDIMTPHPVTVRPETGVQEVARLLVERNISALPVVDGSGKLVGIVREEGVIFQDKKAHLPTFINLSIGFLTLGAKKFEDEIKKITASRAQDIMEKKVLTVDARVTLEDAATMMIEKGSYYLPVVENGALIGVITKKDIVRAIAAGKR